MTKAPFAALRQARLPGAMLAAVLFHAPCLYGQALDLSRYTMVDLTHELAVDATAWPGSRAPFKLDTLVASPTTAMFRITLNEHFATHLDAPRHASGTGWTNEQIPLDRLIAPLVVIDVQAKAALDRDYALLPADIDAHEREFGRIPRGAIVVLRTGWGRYWSDAAMYFGADTTVSPSVLHFPSFGVEAAQLLASRGVAMLGVDSPSTDIGKAPTFAVHGVLGAANVPALENLADCASLPRTGAFLVALPIKTRGGSGGPVRVVALVPRHSARLDLLRKPSDPEWKKAAPAVSRLRVETTRGVFVLEVVRAWGPLGADRLYNLARLGYYDDTRFHRVRPGYIAQWGMHGDSAVNAAWKGRFLADDAPRSRNTRGTFAFSYEGPGREGTRNTQIYVNLADNPRNDAEPFTILGTVVEGMAVLDSLYGGYGEESGSGVRQGKQGPLERGGNAFMDREYPRLDRIVRVTVMSNRVARE